MHLNSLYALTLVKSQQAPEVGPGLSGLMRYLLYDYKQCRMPLATGIECRKHFIALEEGPVGKTITWDHACSGPKRPSRGRLAFFWHLWKTALSMVHATICNSAYQRQHTPVAGVHVEVHLGYQK